MPTSSAVTAGTNATAGDVNDIRTDAITNYVRLFFEIKGTLVTGNELAVIPLPADMTITKIKHKCATGSCTLRVQKETSDIKASISVGTSYADETSGLSNTAGLEGEEISIDLTGVSSAEDLRVLVYGTETQA